MGNRIIKLPEELANCIAAGEVVDRPASVVKELIENSIDANASTIAIDVKDSGKRYIRVTDDGIGMQRDDAILSFERYATSKIKTYEDLHAITTLGFRGEALPSIASVSQVRILTYYDGDNAGTEIELDKGTIKSVKDSPPMKGTSIEVRDLFFNIPARLKFLKSDTTELLHIIEAVTQNSLCYPQIKFGLAVNKTSHINSNYKKVINTPLTHNTIDRIASIFGSDVIKKLLLFTEENHFMKLKGYVSKPGGHFSNKRLQYIFVNNRYIRDRTINHAVYVAFKTTLPRDSHPAYFIFLDIDPRMVDVNVHPAKGEVKFAQQREVHDFVMDAVTRSQKPKAMSQTCLSGRQVSEEEIFFHSKHNTHEPQPVCKYTVKEMSGAYVQVHDELIGSEFKDLAVSSITPEIPDSMNSLLTPETVSVLSQCKPVGQIFNSFIIFEGIEKIIFIDQHTAHERILYEKFLNKIKDSKIEVQNLLLPINIEMSGKESIVLQSRLDSFKQLGFDIEFFGGNSFIIRSVPSILSRDDCEEIVKDILDKLVSYQEDTPFDKIVQNIILIMACRGAVKANQKLSLEEMEHLLRDLKNTNRPFTCPHGRPTALTIEKKLLMKGFLRR
jgi:DNA mismatch repair protein MutL